MPRGGPKPPACLQASIARFNVARWRMSIQFSRKTRKQNHARPSPEHKDDWRWVQVKRHEETKRPAIWRHNGPLRGRAGARVFCSLRNRRLVKLR
jgi:hypothetical protein